MSIAPTLAALAMMIRRRASYPIEINNKELEDIAITTITAFAILGIVMLLSIIIIQMLMCALFPTFFLLGDAL